VRFEIVHEFDAPLDAVELAVLSSDLGSMLAKRLTKIESVETVEHTLGAGQLRRVLRFQASAPLAMFKNSNVARDAMSWCEDWTYRLADHAGTWTVAPKPEYQKHFGSSGTYQLEAIENGRTRRTVVGDVLVHMRIVGTVAARMAISEVKKTYDAEAEVLRHLSIL
jgi:hypothetical protein